MCDENTHRIRMLRGLIVVELPFVFKTNSVYSYVYNCCLFAVNKTKHEKGKNAFMSDARINFETRNDEPNEAKRAFHF